MSYKPVDAAITMVVGPCVDDTDFKSLEEAIAYNAAGMDVSLIVEKTDGTTAVTDITLTTGGTSDWTHKDGGYYEIEVTAAQNAEEGVAYLRGVCTGVLPFESAHYNIVKANVYDSWVKGTDVLQTDLTQIGGAAQSATDLKDFADAGYDPATNKITGTADMRGTDSANTTTPPTVTAIRQEMDTNSTKMAPSQTLNDYKATGFATQNPPSQVLADYKATGFSTHDAAAVKTAIEQAGSSIAQILADTNELQTDWANDGRLDLIIDIIAADTTTDIPELILKYTQLLARSDAAIATDNATELTAINADGGSGAGDFSNQTDGIEAIRDRGDAAWTTGAGGSPPTTLQNTTIATLASQTSFTLTAGSADDNAYTGMIIIVQDAVTATQKAVGYISNYAGADKTITLYGDPGIFTMAVGDTVYIIAAGTPESTADAVFDEILTGATHNIPTSAGRRIREIGAFAIHSGTAQAGNSHSITVAASASPSDAAYHGIYNRNLIVITDNTGVGQTRTIVDYDAITKVVVVDRDWRISPDATTEYQITPDDTPLTVDHGVARGGTNRTITIRTYAASDDDAYLCNIVTIIAGAGRGQARLVDSYDGTNKIVTICGDDWVVTPDTTSVYVMMPYGVACAACMGSEALDEIADCVWDEDLTIHTTSNSAGWFIQKIKSIANFIRIKLL